MQMSVIDWIKTLFGTPKPEPEAVRLDATTYITLEASLKNLSPGQQGWIERAESERFFVLEESQIGILCLSTNCSSRDSGGRIYFIKKN
jgi:hypothetical protein